MCTGNTYITAGRPFTSVLNGRYVVEQWSPGTAATKNHTLLLLRPQLNFIIFFCLSLAYDIFLIMLLPF